MAVQPVRGVYPAWEDYAGSGQGSERTTGSVGNGLHQEASDRASGRLHGDMAASDTGTNGSGGSSDRSGSESASIEKNKESDEIS